MIFHNGNFVATVVGNALTSLQDMANGSIHCCVTSPPYFGLRNYGHAEQIGLEATPDEYIARMVEVFREVRRVLTDDGTLWLNIGDSYARTGGTDRNDPKTKIGGTRSTIEARGNRTQKAPDGIKEKDLIGIPWMLAFALRADGWYLRQDIIWNKPNPMPESVTDRCTKAHEYMFLLSKSPRYYFDSEAIKEPAVKGASGSTFNGGKTGEHQLGRSIATARVEDGKRNRRSVWTITPKPYKGAHFAVYPPELITPCILAGTSERGHCPVCETRWTRQVEKTAMVISKTDRNDERGTRTGTSGTMVSPSSSITVGWKPGCKCGVAPIPDMVLDPFGGSGTTAGVALAHGRNAILLELNPEYAELRHARVASIVINHRNTHPTGE